MCRPKKELKVYHNQQLMNDTNDMFMRIKTHIFELNNDNLKIKYSKPSNQELDNLMNRLFVELQKDNEPVVKH